MAEQDRVKDTGIKTGSRTPTDFANWSDDKLNRRLATLAGRGRGWQPFVRCSKCQHKARNARAGQPCQNHRPGQDACPGTYQREPHDFVRDLDRLPVVARQLKMTLSMTVWPNGEADLWVADIEHGVMRRQQHVCEAEIGHKLAAMLVDAADLRRKLRYTTDAGPRPTDTTESAAEAGA